MAKMDNIGEIILSSAIWKGQVFAIGKRHSDCFRILATKGHPSYRNDAQQGFYTNKGRFIGREEAYELAKNNGQLIRDKAGNLYPGYLFSENLR